MQSEIFEYDVVFSFADENRAYVSEVARSLTDRGVKVFYDDFEKTVLLGKELVSYLHDIYYSKGRFCVMFISEHYVGKLWTEHERKSAQARALKDKNETYIIPARFDNTEIPGMPPTIGYVDLTKYKPIGFAIEILKKLGRLDNVHEATRDSWESYGWLLDIDGYRVPYIPLLNDWRDQDRYKVKGLMDIVIAVDSEPYKLPKDFRAKPLLSKFVNKPSCRLDFYSLKGSEKLVLRFKETSYGDYLRSGEHLDDPFPDQPKRTFRDEFGKISREQSGDLRPFLLTNICGVGLFILTSDNHLVATIHSKRSHVYPGRKTFSASGTMKWGAFPDPFTEILRKSESEINHLVNIRNLQMIGFGADARKLYFQFSFLETTHWSLKEIRDNCSSKVSIFSIPFSLEQVCDALISSCWEPAAEAALLTICANEFGRDAVAHTLAGRKNDWGRREMFDEWDYRAARPGFLPDMSVRYPIEQLQVGSDEYLDHAFRFIGSGVDGKKVLEIGSGTGRFTERLLQYASEVTCVELSERMIEHCRNRLNKGGRNGARLHLRHGFAQELLPLQGNDVIICSLVLIHNVRDTDFAGLVAGMCESADTLFLFEDITQERKTSPHTRLRSEEELVAAFATHGFAATRRDYHDLFTDKIVFIELKRP